jgi:hypothetical protein
LGCCDPIFNLAHPSCDYDGNPTSKCIDHA